MRIGTIGILVFLVGFIPPILSPWCGGDLPAFIHIPSLLYVTVLPAGLAMVKCRKGADKSKLLKSFKRYLIPCGAMGTLTGVVQMASACLKAGTLNPVSVLAGFSVAVLTVLYALLLYCIIDVCTEQKPTAL
jgi:hypothetical protein